MACTEYIPYTLTQIETQISNIYEAIIENRGMSKGERIKNGTDEYESGNTLNALYEELDMWKELRRKKLIELNECTGKKFYVSGQYGC